MCRGIAPEFLQLPEGHEDDLAFDEALGCLDGQLQLGGWRVGQRHHRHDSFFSDGRHPLLLTTTRALWRPGTCYVSLHPARVVPLGVISFV